MITGPGLDNPVNADTAIKHIEQLYDPHIRQYFTYKGQPLPAWCDHLKFECKVLGRNMAMHGVANYAISNYQVQIYRQSSKHGATALSPRTTTPTVELP